jgi:hypothetical protein
MDKISALNLLDASKGIMWSPELEDAMFILADDAFRKVIKFPNDEGLKMLGVFVSKIESVINETPHTEEELNSFVNRIKNPVEEDIIGAAILVFHLFHKSKMKEMFYAMIKTFNEVFAEDGQIEVKMREEVKELVATISKGIWNEEIKEMFLKTMKDVAINVFSLALAGHKDVGFDLIKVVGKTTDILMNKLKDRKQELVFEFENKKIQDLLVVHLFEILQLGPQKRRKRYDEVVDILIKSKAEIEKGSGSV